MDLIALAVPFFLVAIACELLWGCLRATNTYRLNDSFSSLMLGILSQARKFVVLGVGGYVYAFIAAKTAFPQWSVDSAMTWVVAFVLYDFCYYWSHRCGHERQLLWAAHVVHHQSEEYNLSTALRQTSSGFLLSWIFYVPLFVLGIPAEVVVTVGAINLIYQFWVHTRHIPELGWFEWVFVTPSNHRVHHAQNSLYMDRNYGGVFIVWDRLFGTYQRELPDEPCIYGIRGAIKSWNPWTALTHIYVDMINDIRHTSSWLNRWRVLCARTGWQPADVAERWPRNKTDLSQFERYNPPSSGWLKWYGAVQIMGATALLTFGQVNPLSLFGYWLIWGLLVWTGVATAWWLEGRGTAFCLAVDAPRMAALLVVCTVGGLSNGWWMVGWAWFLTSAGLIALEMARVRAELHV